MLTPAEEREKIEVKTNSRAESFIFEFFLVLVCSGRRNKFQIYGGNDVSISLIGEEDIGNS